MRKYLSIIFLIPFCSSVLGQEIEFGGAYSVNSRKSLNNILGYEIAFNIPVNANTNVGLPINYYSFKKSYDDRYAQSPDADPDLYYIFHVDNKSKIFSLKPYIESILFRTTKTNFYWGVDVPINYFNINHFNVQGWYNYLSWDSINQVSYNNKSRFQLNNTSKYWNFGIGCFIKVELKEFIFPRLSLNFKISPEFIFIQSHLNDVILFLNNQKNYFGYFRDIVPFGTINFQLGISYKLKSNKK